MSSRTSDVAMRRAQPADAATIARHRADMFSDMGQLPPQLRAALEEATRLQLTDALRAGEYVGWLAVASDGDGAVIAGGGGSCGGAAWRDGCAPRRRLAPQRAPSSTSRP